MTLYNEANAFALWQGELINGIRYPLGIYSWPAADLEAIGLWRDDMIAPADPVPEGKMVLSQSVQRVGGVVRWVQELGDAPEPGALELTTYAADRRWEREVGGTQVGGMFVHTDDRSKTLIMGARLAATIDPEFTTDFKTASGAFVTMDAATIIAISDAVLAHVAACFAVEAAVLAAIENQTITTTAQIDAAWSAAMES